MPLPDDMSTTSGPLALANLQAQIEGLQARVDAGRSSVEEQAGLLELVTLRGLILGRIADYQWVEEQAERLIREFPTAGVAFVARARSRGTFHRFTDALADLEEAERRGQPRELVDGERAGIYQALGRYEEALALVGAAVERQRDFASLGALATLHSDMGDTARAEQLFAESRGHYRGVSPIPVALLDFQRGHMWMAEHEPARARAWFRAAVGRLPGFAPAEGHLAEVDAEAGEHDSAMDRLRALAMSCDDPDYAAALARLLGDGHADEAGQWRLRAAARYDELTERHPEAFADHAAAFWLGAGDHPRRALAFARANLEVRKTRRAYDLVERTERAVMRGSHATDELPTTIRGPKWHNLSTPS